MDFSKLVSDHSACDIDALGPNLFVSFTARSLRKARVAWLNERFWGDAGLDLSHDDARLALKAWLLEQYAYVIPTAENKADLGERTKVFQADRYGNSKGSLHGGSGRCGRAGPLNVKGIGATPLAAGPDRMDWTHSHGCAWLEECVREAICAEVVCREFPHGGVPVVAIIDTGLTVRADNQHGGGRRGLIVRPNFVRMAHLERSIYFGSGGAVGSDQHVDSQRVRDAVGAVWGSDSRRNELGVEAADLIASVCRYGDQLAYGYAHRFWLGDVSSSNVTLNGEIVDFGGFSGMPDWCRTRGDLELPRFGEEWPNLLAMIRSLAFYRTKYIGLQTDVSKIARATRAHLEKGFAFQLYAALTGGSSVRCPHSAAVVECLHALFNAQQAVKADILDNIKKHRLIKRTWPYRYIRSRRLAELDDGPGGAFALKIFSDLQSQIKGASLSRDRRARILHNLECLLLGRPLINGYELYARSRLLIATHENAEDLQQHVTRFINDTLRKSSARFRPI